MVKIVSATNSACSFDQQKCSNKYHQVVKNKNNINGDQSWKKIEWNNFFKTSIKQFTSETTHNIVIVVKLPMIESHDSHT